MTDLKQLEILDLTERSAFQVVADAVDEFIGERNRPQGFELLRVLESRLRYINPSQLGPLVQEYEKILVKLKFLTFADLAERDALQLLRQSTIDVYATDLSLTELLRQRVLELPIANRDDFKNRVRDALLHNQQRLSGTTLTMGADNRPETPSLENWIRDYTYRVGTEVAPTFSVAQYFSKNPNISSLPEPERVRVKELLSLYERYKYPSDSVEGFDGVMLVRSKDQFFLLNQGRINPLTESPGKAVTVPTTVVAASPVQATIVRQVSQDESGYAVDDERRYQAQETLLRDTRGEWTALVAAFRNSLAINDNDALVVTLEVLARTGAIETILNEADLRDVMTDEYLRSVLGPDAPLTTVRQQLAKSATSPGAVALFLRWVLLRSFSGNDHQSARIGNQLETTVAALGNPTLVGMTYFDVSQSGFRWAPLRVSQDGTVHWDA